MHFSLPEERKFVRGIISGIPTVLPVELIKDNLERAKVVDVKRLKTTRYGEKCDSLSVMIKFEETRLPNKEFLGYGILVMRSRPIFLPHCDVLSAKDLAT